jgi:hypothetical protein
MIRCYKFWAVPSSAADAALLYDQLRRAGDYRHTLVDIENRSRALQRAIWEHPMREVPIADRAAWREAGGNDVIKAWTKSDDYQALRKQILAGQRIAARRARQDRPVGLHYGTYWLVEEAVSTATRTTKWQDDLGHRAHLRVGAPIDSNAPPTVEGLASESASRVRLGAEFYALGDRVDGYQQRAVGGQARNRGGVLRPARLREVAIRVGSDGRSPVWARLHALLHRELPVNSVVKQAWAQRRAIGGRDRWEVVFAVEMPGELPVVHGRQGAVVGIDLGWRRRPDGVRVAYWLGSDGQEGELVVPIEVEQRKRKSDDLRAIRDRHRNEMQATLRQWVEANRGSWLDEALSHVAQWLRPVRYARLEVTWRAQRVPGDEEIYAALCAYLKQDRHLWAWQANNLKKMERQIRGRFASFAHEICGKYATVAIEDIDLRSLKEDEDKSVDQQPGVPSQRDINARSIQKLAPGELLRAIKAAAPKYGASVLELDAAYTTIDCAACGHRRQIDVQERGALIIRCDACGHAEDQDRTAARNLLAGALRGGAETAEDLPQGTMKKLAPRRNRKRKKVEVFEGNAVTAISDN